MLPGIVLKFLQRDWIPPSQGSVGSWYVYIILRKHKFTTIPSHIACCLAKTAVFMPWHHCKFSTKTLQTHCIWLVQNSASLLHVITLYSPTYSEGKFRSFFFFLIYISCFNFAQEYQKTDFSSGKCSKIHCHSDPPIVPTQTSVQLHNELDQENYPAEN